METMKTYIHWLKIDGVRSEDRQYKEIDKYLKAYPEAKATMFLYKYGMFNRVVKLECSQNYNDLDMIVNSGSHPLRRLTQKPKDIISPRPFEIPDYIKNKLA